MYEEGDNRYRVAAGLVDKSLVHSVLVFDGERQRVIEDGLAPSYQQIGVQKLRHYGVPAPVIETVPGTVGRLSAVSSGCPVTVWGLFVSDFVLRASDFTWWVGGAVKR